MSRSLHPRTALLLLTGLNLLNYVDRSVLFAVQPLVQAEFRRNDAAFGFLTTAFFICYMVTGPIFGYLADRHSRRALMVVGATIWSGATLLTAITHDFTTLLVRHTIVGIGEASFVAIAPSFLADLFPEHRRGKVLAFFYIAIPVGTALGYLLGGGLSKHHGWRYPFYFAGVPGFLLAMALLFLAEPPRGAHDTVAVTLERVTFLGLLRNGSYWSATLGMAMVTFALGGLQVWMPTFLSRARGIALDSANLNFGLITLFNGVFAVLIGGWLADHLLSRTRGAYYLVCAVSAAVSIPFMFFAIFGTGTIMYPAIFAAEFLLLFGTGPLNAAVVNSVGAPIRALAVGVNLFVIHLLGDAFSPTLIGYISDRSSLSTGFLTAIVAVALSVAVLFYGARLAPSISAENGNGASA